MSKRKIVALNKIYYCRITKTPYVTVIGGEIGCFIGV
jgi:hypothetical protein